MADLKEKVNGIKEEIVTDKIDLGNSFEYYNELFERDGDDIEDEFDLADILIETEEGQELMRDLINHLYSYNCTDYSKNLWINDEIQAGEILSYNLAATNKEDVPLYAKIVSSMDLDHEVNQIEDTMRLMEKWGINEYTYPLIVGRIINPGQHGDELLDEIRDDIIEALEENGDYDKFLNLLLDTIRNHESSYFSNFDYLTEMFDSSFSILFEIPSEYEGDEFEDDERFSKFVRAFAEAGKNGKSVKYAELIELDK